MRPAEAKIAACATAYARGAAAAFRGLEREVLVEVVRSLDEAAFAFTLAPNRAELVARDVNRNMMLVGAASAIEPLVGAIEGTPGGVPWGPGRDRVIDVVDNYLIGCGRLATVGRLASLERYGLAETSFAADGSLVIEVASAAEDADELDAGWRHVERSAARLAPRRRRIASMKDWVARRLDRSCDVDDGWYLRYGGDKVLLAYHREYARIEGEGIPEAEALPPGAMLAGRPFQEWMARGLEAQASAYQHVAYATRLRSRHDGLRLRDLLTCFARRDDIEGLWESRGEPPAAARRLASSLTLDRRAARAAARGSEIPLPYYVDFGRDFVLLPLFGALLNPYAGQVWHLRDHYRKDWDRAVGGREAVFRDELRDVLEPRGCQVPPSGFKLRRADGSHTTDVDAAVVDPAGRLVLVQLKWPDIHGRSLSERSSRQRNLAKANAWVEAVSTWCAGRGSAAVGSALGIRATSAEPPALLVMARYTARFSGALPHDPRAGWTSWPRLCEALEAGDLGEALRPGRPTRVAPPKGEPKVTTYALPGLQVEVREHA